MKTNKQIIITLFLLLVKINNDNKDQLNNEWPFIFFGSSSST